MIDEPSNQRGRVRLNDDFVMLRVVVVQTNRASSSSLWNVSTPENPIE